MIYLCLGLVLFFAPHLLREFGLREPFIGMVKSEGAYKGLYSLISLAGLALIIVGKAAAPFVMMWEPYYELRFISHIIMIPAMILIVAGNLPQSFLRKRIRNPMLGGVALWGAAHLWSNGDLASMLVFGSFALWASFKYLILSSQQNGSLKKESIVWDVVSVAVGLIGYILISTYHGQLFGVGLNYV